VTIISVENEKNFDILGYCFCLLHEGVYGGKLLSWQRYYVAQMFRTVIESYYHALYIILSKSRLC